jgi:uncharacterized protein
VLAETCFLVRDIHNGFEAVLSLVRKGAVEIAFDLSQEVDSISELLQRYRSVPMSLADGCLVRMTEIYPQSLVLTLDSDFMIYRKHRNQIISVVMP